MWKNFLFLTENIENVFALFEYNDVEVMYKTQYLTNDLLDRGSTCLIFW